MKLYTIIRKSPLLLSMILLLASCTKDEVAPEVSYQNGVLSCSPCSFFGRVLAIDDTHLLVAKIYKVYGFVLSGQEWKLNQVLEFDQEVMSMEVENNSLGIGLSEFEGTGRIKLYELVASRWEEVQELRSGMYNFGAAIDMEGDMLMVGSERFGNIGGAAAVDTSCIYFYKKEGRSWFPAGSFQPEPGEEELGAFGESVALQGNFAYALFKHWDPEELIQKPDLHVYTFDGDQWHFKEKWADEEAIGWVNDLSSDGDNLMIAGSVDSESPIRIFNMQDGRPVGEFNVEYDFRRRYSTYGPVHLQGDYAALLVDGTEEDSFQNHVYLLHLENDSWSVHSKYPAEEYHTTFGYDLRLTDQWLVISDDHLGKVYLHPK